VDKAHSRCAPNFLGVASYHQEEITPATAAATTNA
jgi:hypothetical protein